MDEADLLKRDGFTTEAILKAEAVDENGNFDDVVRVSIVNCNSESNLSKPFGRSINSI